MKKTDKFDLDSLGMQRLKVKLDINLYPDYYIEGYKFYQTINQINTAEIFVFDLTKWSKELLTVFFKNFFEIQENMLKNLFFKRENQFLRFNSKTVFVIEDNSEFLTEMWKIQEDYNYMRKIFIKKKDAMEYIEYLLELNDVKGYNKTPLEFSFLEHSYTLTNLNLICGLNGSGKTRMLRCIQEKEPGNIKCFSLESYLKLLDFDELLCKFRRPAFFAEYETKSKSMKKIYKKITSYMDKTSVLDEFILNSKNPRIILRNFSWSEKFFLIFSLFLNAIPKEKVILLFDIPWGAVSEKYVINIIEFLQHLSCKGYIVCCTAQVGIVEEAFERKCYGINKIKL